jgi:dipeptidyl-peptidase-4
VDNAETLSIPPTATLRDRDGKEIKKLAESDLSRFDALNLKKVEQFAFTAADGTTKCYGYLEFPSDFDENAKYPLVVSVYGGPESGTSVERFQTPNPITEFGFIQAWIDGRGTQSRGRDFRQSVYEKLGIVEIDDQAAAVKQLASRPYIDGARVGIYGTSYGGYASLMCLLRYPDVFAAASSSSPVTSWLNYDSIYTERFMNTPQVNPSGYENGSAMKYAADLKGRLLLYWGTSDNNVHPSNSLQLIRALARAGKSFDISVGPDQGHSGVNNAKMWELFIENLILKKKDALKVAWNARKRRVANR